MFNLLGKLCKSDTLELASIITSSILSFAVIIVSIITARYNQKSQKLNNKLQEKIAVISKDSACWPFKVEIVNSLMLFDAEFYNVCTHLLITQNVIQNDVDKSIERLDLMLTRLYSDRMKLKVFFDEDSEFYKYIQTIENETTKLYVNLVKCQFVLVADIKLGLANKKKNPVLNKCERLERDILDIEDRFTLYTQGMDPLSIDFIMQYAKVFRLLANLNAKDIFTTAQYL